MAVTKTLVIDGRPVAFKASAAIPRIYRSRYGRDIFADLNRLVEALGENDAEASGLDIPSLEVFEDIAYTMAKYADPSAPDTPEEWLDAFNVFSIYTILPEIVRLWGINVKTTVEAKKKGPGPSAL